MKYSLDRRQIDNGPIQTMDLYAKTVQAARVVWQTAGLAPAVQHEVTIKATGTKTAHGWPRRWTSTPSFVTRQVTRLTDYRSSWRWRCSPRPRSASDRRMSHRGAMKATTSWSGGRLSWPSPVW